LGATNYPGPYPQFSGLCVTGSATNAEIWMTDFNPLGLYGNTIPSTGIVRWQLGLDGTVATNDTGTIIAPVTNSSPMSWSPYDVSVDTNGFIYTIQQVPTSYANMGIVPIICFSPFEGFPETNAVWTAGTNDSSSMIFEYGVAVDPTATYVAVAIRGDGDAESGATGLLNLYYATNGQFFANIDPTGGDLYVDVAWDNVGNLYGLDLNDQLYRAFSPPASNQATTVAVPFVQAYNMLTLPTLLNPVVGGNCLNFILRGQSNVTYVVEQSPDLMSWDPVCTNYSADADRPISLSCDDDQLFVRAVAIP
jgi:hypothetical protein